MSQIVYRYVAYDKNGETIKGKFVASSVAIATDLLSSSGFQVIDIKPLSSLFDKDKLLKELFRVKTEEVILFYRQLALLLESGLDIITSLELLQNQCVNRVLMNVIGEVIANVRTGSQLSVALNKHPEIFSSICCQTLRVGEQTGNIEAMLKQIVEYLEKEITTGKDIKDALRYPVITAIVAVVVVLVLVTFVLPSFTSLYTMLGAELPFLTRVMLDLADFMKIYGLYVILVFLLMVGAVFAYSNTEQGKLRKDKLTLRLPLLGKINHLKELARCCRSISLLFSAGLPMNEIMTLVVQVCDNQIINKALVDVQQAVIGGEGLSQAMSRSGIFLPMMVQMVGVGEATGNLDVTLLATAQNYETEAQYRTRSLIAFIQPAVTLAIGIVVAIIALSLVSAMYSVYGQVL